MILKSIPKNFKFFFVFFNFNKPNGLDFIPLLFLVKAGLFIYLKINKIKINIKIREKKKKPLIIKKRKLLNRFWFMYTNTIYIKIKEKLIRNAEKIVFIFDEIIWFKICKRFAKYPNPKPKPKYSKNWKPKPRLFRVHMSVWYCH